MLEWVDVLLGGALTWASIAYGQRHNRRKGEIESQKEPEPICGCNHHFSKHDENGECQFRWEEQILVERGQPKTVRTGPDGFRREVVYDHEKWETREYACTCKRYTGPEPLFRYVS